MKNIMIIDGAENCVYDVFGVPDDDFVLIFPDGTDVAFIEDVVRRPNAERVVEASLPRDEGGRAAWVSL